MKVERPSGAFILGHLDRFRRDVLLLLREAAASEADMVRYRLATQTYHLINHPAAIEHVLVRGHANYIKRTRSARIIGEVAGASLLTTDGDSWRQQRKLIQPSLQPHRVQEVADIVANVMPDFESAWDAHVKAGTTIDWASEMSRVTFTVAGRALFGTDVALDGSVVEQALGVVLAQTWRRLENIVNIPRSWPTPANRAFRRALSDIDAVVLRILRQRRERKDPGPDLLGRLLGASCRAGEGGMTERQLRNEILTLLLAGHETTANALTWTFYLLAGAPEVECAIADQCGHDDEAATSTSGPDSTLLSAVLREALRLYPPIWIMERRVVNADQIDGYSIPAGSTVVVSPYALHRRPSFWLHPELFVPDRFRDEKDLGMTFLPFGVGPHQCVGSHFAMVEARAVLRRFYRRYRLKIRGTKEAVPQPGITLRMQKGLPVQLLWR